MDAKLSVIETREQRLNFITFMHNNLKQGILRGLTDSERSRKIVSGTQRPKNDEQVKDVLFCIDDLDKMLVN